MVSKTIDRGSNPRGPAKMQIERVHKLNKNEYPALDWNFPGGHITKNSVQTFLNNSMNYLILAKENDMIIGILRAHYMPRLDDKKASILLYEIDVHPEHRQEGVGTALIEKLKEIASNEGIHEIWVVTNKSNEAAMVLYKTTGAVAKHNDDIVLEYHL